MWIGRSTEQIAEEIGCARSPAVQAMKRFGISARPPQEPRHAQLKDLEWLAKQVRAGRSPCSISEEAGCHPTSVTGALRGQPSYTDGRPVLAGGAPPSPREDR